MHIMLCINTANGGSDLNGVNFEDRRGPAVYEQIKRSAVLMLMKCLLLPDTEIRNRVFNHKNDIYSPEITKNRKCKQINTLQMSSGVQIFDNFISK